MSCGFEWQEDGSLKFTMLADVGKTKDGKFYLKKWSFNDGKDWIYPCNIDNVKTTESRGGEGKSAIPSVIGYIKGKYTKGLDARMELKRIEI